MLVLSVTRTMAKWWLQWKVVNIVLLLFNCSWYLYITSHSNKLHFNIIPPKYVFVVPDTETMHKFCDYVIRHHQEKGSAFGSAFGPSPNLNQTL